MSNSLLLWDGMVQRRCDQCQVVGELDLLDDFLIQCHYPIVCIWGTCELEGIDL